jgi:pantoate--beta-alanine ligase
MTLASTNVGKAFYSLINSANPTIAALKRKVAEFHDAQEMCQRMMALIESEPLAEVDYVSVADTETLEELEEINCPTLVLLAVRIGKTRLIDNITLSNPLKTEQAPS